MSAVRQAFGGSLTLIKRLLGECLEISSRGRVQSLGRLPR